MKELTSACPELASCLYEAEEVSSFLWQKGWAECNGGNLSVDVSKLIVANAPCLQAGEHVELESSYPTLSGHYFLVTGSGRRFRDLSGNLGENACIIKLDDDGSGYRYVWPEGKLNFHPTSELPSHLSIHSYLQDKGKPQRIVLHTHPTELIAMTHLPEYKDEDKLNPALWGMMPEVKVIIPDGAGLAPYRCPGSEELAAETIAAFERGHSVILWEMHGCLATGETIMQAFDQIDTLNKAATIFMHCLKCGHAPKGINSEQLDELVEKFLKKG